MTPLWEGGKLYLPGDLVQPASAIAAYAIAIANGNFESGDTGWTKGVGWRITNNSTISYEGSWFAEQLTAGNTYLESTTDYAVEPGQRITLSGVTKGGTDPGNGAALVLAWYDAAKVLISRSEGGLTANADQKYESGTFTGTAPTNAAYVRPGLRGNVTGTGHYGVGDALTWNYTTSTLPPGLIYRAVQAAAGTSGNIEPAWPTTLGLQVTDNGVTWEAVLAARVTWKAKPIAVTGATEPTWPTRPGAFVSDGTVSWECVTRAIEDENCPHTKVVAIMAGKVFAADGDIVRFSATANPRDWSSSNDAGYLPTGLQQANANDMAVLAPYRGNLACFNASSFQLWQVDPDPAAMALLDQMEGVGSTWTLAAQPVANDLPYLSQQGVRSVGIANATQNLAAGDIGSPIDPLVQAAMTVASANSTKALATHYPGAGQYWLAFSDYPPAALAIGGALPDAAVHDVVNFQYTTAGGVRPYGSYSIASGALPAGLSMDAAGLVTGTLTAAGAFTWTVSRTDADGTVATLAESATVIRLVWWLVFAGTTGNDEEVWETTDPLTWPATTTRAPNVDPTYGLHRTATTLVAYSGAQAEVASDLDFAGGIATTLTTPTYPGAGLTGRIDVVDGVLFTLGQANYSMSVDGGLTWTNHASPGGLLLGAVARLSSGRWLALRLPNQDFGAFYYSDDPTPVTWTLATNADTSGAPQNALFSYGTGAFNVSNVGDIRRTLDGTSWDYTAALVPLTYGDADIYGATDGSGTWVLSADAKRQIVRSTDNGFTWAVVAMPGGAVADVDAKVSYGHNVFVATFTDKAFASTDGGATWTEATLPVTGKGGAPKVEFLGATA